MMNTATKNIEDILRKLPEVTAVDDVRIKDGIIECITIGKTSIGRLVVQRLKVEDSTALFDFYFDGLSEESKRFWPPYPLFSPPVNSAEELANRIKDWQREDDWTVLKLVKGDQFIGIGLLKRCRTERPVSGLAVREEYQQKGIGVLLQTIINEQARLLGIPELYATLAPDNTASLKVHLKCGFRQTGKLVPHFIYNNGVKVIDRQDIEMVKEISYE